MIGGVLLVFILGIFVGFYKGLNAFIEIENKQSEKSVATHVTVEGPNYKAIIIANTDVKKGMLFNRNDFLVFTGNDEEVLSCMLKRCILPIEVSEFVGHPVQCDIDKGSALFRSDLVPR